MVRFWEVARQRRAHMATSRAPWSEGGTQVYSGPAAVARLRELCALRPDAFANAASRGSELSGSLLPVHPRTYPGQVMWAETTAALRMQVLDLQQNWKIGRENNYETVYAPTHGVAIVIVGADNNTGVRGFDHPRARRPRGPMTAKRVSKNRQLALEIQGMPISEDAADADLTTWFFLLNAREGQLFSELSSPVDIGEDRRVITWSERILFEPLQIEGAVTPTLPDDGSDDPPVVRVGRRG